jgi:hypothetical protein
MKNTQRPFVPLSLFTAISLLGATGAGLAATRPTVVITFPGVNHSVSDAMVTATGKASDKEGVASVYYQLNTSAWAPASTTNHWANWTASVALVPGLNTLRAYALSTGGSYSLTNTVNFTYVVSAPLTVHTNGQGTVTPNYAGKLLQIGKSYTLTAVPAQGFAFTQWAGSTNSYSTRLTFQMASNLVFTANFEEVAHPVLIILAPKANAKESVAALEVSGKAGDIVAVGGVFYRLNGGGWSLASTSNEWTNWTAEVTLSAGVNTIQAYATNAAGNASLTNNVKCSLAGPAGDLAPDSISGMSVRFTSSYSTATMAFGQSTYSETMLPGTDVDHNVVGNYTYTKLSPTTAQISLMNTAPPDKADTAFVVGTLTFSPAGHATYAGTNWEGSVSTATLTFSQAPDTAPDSLAGKTAHAAASGATMQLFADGTATGTYSSGAPFSATYTFTRYSPVGGLLVVTATAPPDRVGDVSYMILTFSSASAGSLYYEGFDPSGDLTDSAPSSFTIK